MDLPPRLESLLRRGDEQAAEFAARVEAHVRARADEGWQLQARQDHEASVDLVFVHPPVP